MCHIFRIFKIITINILHVLLQDIKQPVQRVEKEKMIY